MKRIVLLSCLFVATALQAQPPMSEQMAATVMSLWKDSFALDGKPARWTYDMGVILKGFEGIWQRTGDQRYFDYIRKQMDVFVQEDGSIRTYKPAEYNIDHINNGKLLFLLYRTTGKQKYLDAAKLLRQQLLTHPRTKEGGFWHKKIYSWQMWLDGLYMGAPFYAEYAKEMKEDTAFNDVANQFIWMEQHARDPRTGLLYHAWDESREQAWANKKTGASPLFWARAMGWYATALVDALDYFPEQHPKRVALIAILNRLVTAIEKVQDPATGLWYDILAYNGPGKEKNYFEASASSQFVYAVAKGVRKGYLPAEKKAIAEKGYAGILQRFIKTENGQTNLYGTVKVSGLGGKPYRDGSFSYYMSEPVIVNDPKGIGAFLLASNEMEGAGSAPAPKRIVVAADGSGQFRSIQGAINSLPDSSATPIVIYIRKGIYKEKLYVEKHHIIFEGEDRDHTIIVQSISRDEWRCGHGDDWGVATVNIGANDITLKNLTITNDFGFNYTPRTIYCPSDSVNQQKLLARYGHQMALRTMNNATRLRAINCHFRAYGGDTVSPWEVENGLWYFKDCLMEGGVDFYCPRGWAWAENCEFVAHGGSAAIWHDGSKVEDSKTVLVNCRFRGYDNFLLGRYHRDAQFYLLHCSFADNMRDSAIYRVPTSNTIRWGHRVYYYDCHRKAGDYAWFGDNISPEQAGKINVEWVFGSRWRPAE